MKRLSLFVLALIMMAGLKGEPLKCDSPGVQEIINKVCEFK